ncbi:DUF5837 family cyanobactin class RiPP [Anabaena azotica]|uniref:Microcyclamide/patellamide family RiPP n=1 Tax=Anabaena azotica FACHB-119 TaxID=947527 RepID=A0ABR8DDG4_9NOST|nr:DUF5837 family cyanobactin class RiPP [Anabaena azotica]MBD2504679.1 microcyclamide/patellamide family RiPP [Anabaena azotica FACHB-119]
MNKKNLIPQQTQPVLRLTSGTQTHLLAELSEEVLCNTTGASASIDTGIRYGGSNCGIPYICSYDGEDV